MPKKSNQKRDSRNQKSFFKTLQKCQNRVDLQKRL